MATIKTWVVTSTVCHGSVETDEDTTIEAHSLVLEPSGALSFWIVSNDGMQSILVLAFPIGEWKLVKIAPNNPGKPSRL